MFKKMSNWIGGFFGSKKEEVVPEKFNLYQPKERIIYYYFNGDKVVAADPMLLWRKLSDVRGDLWADAQLAYSISSKASQGYDNMIRKMRAIFDVKPLAEGGLSDPEVNDLFDNFLFYIDSVKKNSPTSATTSTATSTPTPQPIATPAGAGSNGSHPTTSTLASGSTEKEPTTDGPAPSPSVPVSPSV